MRKRILLILLLFISVISLADSNVASDYSDTVSYDWDSFAQMLSLYMEKGLKSIERLSIYLLSTFFVIQFVFDAYKTYATFNLIEFSKTFIRKLLTFSVYLFAIKKIIDGTVFRVVEEISYKLLEKLTGQVGVQKISNIWEIKEKITLNLWEAIAKLWGVWSILPGEFAQDFIFTLVLLVVILFLNIAFFMMMLNLFKALMSFKLVLGLSAILLPFGVMEETKEYYNIGKILSLALNFSIKLISINFIATVIMNSLNKNDSILNFVANDITSVISQSFIIFLVLVGVMWHLTTKLEINF
ncbi:type IV secretion system protein [Streptobacillus moniliformis]|uniref:type IV secretion system protein n=1 Tax=Streptobacillus moniliformis TaxID=34105 RepID=UPI0007E3C9C6|nr:type IV secretion system protein [Streptobacillus moniliformis]